MKPSFLKDAMQCETVEDVVKLMAEDAPRVILCSREVYDAIPAHRQSDFKMWLKSPMYYPYEKKYPPERPAYFRDGSLFDSLLFDTPEETGKRFIVGPDVNRNTKEYKAFAEANAGKEIFKPAEFDQIVGYAESFKAHPQWKKLTAGEHAFQVVFIGKLEGIWMKAAADMFTPTCLVDAKLLSEADENSFGKKYVKDFGYDIQAAWYRYLCPVQGIPLYFACQEKHGYPETVPNSCQWFKPADDDIGQAMLCITKRLPEFDAALKLNNFPGYSQDIATVKAPVYAERIP